MIPGKFMMFMVLLGIMCLIGAESVYGEFSYGARAMGMGDAFVAVADDASSVFWNPAGCVLAKGWNVGMQYGKNEVVADDVQDTLEYGMSNNPGDWTEPFSSEDIQDLRHDLSRLATYEWIHKGGEHLGFSVTNAGSMLMLTNYTVLFVQPDIDEENIGDDPSESNYIKNNDSRLTMGGFDISEYGFGYAWISQSKAFSMGVVAKYADIKGYYGSISLWGNNSSDPGDLLDTVEDMPSFDDHDWGIDAGIMFYAKTSRLGIAAKNLNGYKIDVSEEITLKVKPEYRIGYAYIPGDRFMFALDYALTKTRDPLGNKMDGKDLAMGFEAKLGDTKWLILRGGASMSMGGDNPMLFNGGLGLSFQHVCLDFGYATDQNGDSTRILSGLRVFL